MFLIIFEDGLIKTAKDIGDDDKDMADDGYVDLIDISSPSEPKRYRSGDWELVEDIDD